MGLSLKPLSDRVVVEPAAAEEKSSGGIILPDTAQEKPSEGTVVAVGNGVRGDDGSITPLDVKKGDHVLFGKTSKSFIFLLDAWNNYRANLVFVQSEKSVLENIPWGNIFENSVWTTVMLLYLDTITNDRNKFRTYFSFRFFH